MSPSMSLEELTKHTASEWGLNAPGKAFLAALLKSQIAATALTRTNIVPTKAGQAALRQHAGMKPKDLADDQIKMRIVPTEDFVEKSRESMHPNGLGWFRARVMIGDPQPPTNRRKMLTEFVVYHAESQEGLVVTTEWTTSSGGDDLAAAHTRVVRRFLQGLLSIATVDEDQIPDAPPAYGPGEFVPPFRPPGPGPGFGPGPAPAPVHHQQAGPPPGAPPPNRMDPPQRPVQGNAGAPFPPRGPAHGPGMGQPSAGPGGPAGDPHLATGNPQLAAGRVPVDLTRPGPYPQTNWLRAACSVCGVQQFVGSFGVSCANGHSGAASNPEPQPQPVNGQPSQPQPQPPQQVMLPPLPPPQQPQPPPQQPQPPPPPQQPQQAPPQQPPPQQPPTGPLPPISQDPVVQSAHAMIGPTSPPPEREATEPTQAVSSEPPPAPEPATEEEWMQALVKNGWPEHLAETFALAPLDEPIDPQLRDDFSLRLGEFYKTAEAVTAALNAVGFQPDASLPKVARPRPTGLQMLRCCLKITMKKPEKTQATTA